MDWTQQQYERFWKTQKEVERIIDAGEFDTLLTDGFERAKKKTRIKEGESIIKKLLKKK